MNQNISTNKKGIQKSAMSATPAGKKSQGFTAEEKAAMKARARELKASDDAAEAENVVLAKINEMPEPDRSMGRRLHTIIKASAPVLSAKLWYGQPAYAKDGKIVCFFQPAHKFNTRYATLGFNDAANLDEGDMWPTYYALKDLTAATEARITALVKKAVS